MSEYQYYEFRAVDRPLTKGEMAGVRRYSSRAEITPTGFVNVYDFGDFRGDVEDFLTRYYDAFVYVANWGTRRVAFRVPREALDWERIAAYETEQSVRLSTAGKNALIYLELQDEEGGDWVEGEGWMERLLPLRQEIVDGDLRALYLGWLIDAQGGLMEEDAMEPATPAGLSKLSEAQDAFVEFMGLSKAWMLAAERKAAARKRELEELRGRQEDAWNEVEGLISLKNGKAYDQAVATLRALREVAVMEQAEKQFGDRVAALRKKYLHRPGLQSKLRKVDLGARQ